MSKTQSRFVKVGVVLPGKAGIFGHKHVGVWDLTTNLVLELTNRTGTDKILIKTSSLDDFRTDSDGTKKEVTQEATANPKLPDESICQLWNRITERWNNRELDKNQYEVVPNDMQSSCESLAEEVMTGIPSTPQADTVRGTIFEEIAKMARSISNSSPEFSGGYEG